ncbi:PREDICTED: juvenile hormone esterase-like [Dinoponera quadriceps]|uniref:Juvenile hormone esterase-like n=1 Tax=Dinoponera quadriceps TaxID=609295 RepID=A0A6P3XPJ4_DINQU|nr:PREDICTED: juvenile hormone esterase-like [Dinoponera quadriceps]
MIGGDNILKSSEPAHFLLISRSILVKLGTLPSGDEQEINLDMLNNIRTIVRSAVAAVMKNTRVDVHVRQGKLRGIVEENVHGGYFTAFRGIPYAQPPVGELRFRDPQPAEPWDGVRDASKFGQAPLQVNLFTRQLDGSEDCLYLNVYTTDVEPTSGKRPVMVWLYGGSYTNGSGDDFMYGPDHIVRKDVVLVTLNYRLGAFGFLNLGNDVAGGNQGLKDTIMALQWVRDNISNFGGDPENVTLFGESVGAAIAHYLTMNPLADGLYHKMIMQSGTMLCQWALAIPGLPFKKALQLTEKLGKQTTDLREAGEFLKTVDANTILNVSQTLLSTYENRQFLLSFLPDEDFRSPNPFFSEKPLVLARRGIKVPLLLGYTSNEGSFFTRNLSDKAVQMVNSNFENTVPSRIMADLRKKSITAEDIRYLYFGNKSLTKETLKHYTDYISDLLFYRPIQELANIQMQIGHDSTYLYKFSYDNRECLLKKMMNITDRGVTHVQELFYLFYPYVMKQFDIPPYALDSEDYKTTDRFTQMWTDFAKTGNPTPAVTDLIPTVWEPLQAGQMYNYLDIDKELQMKIDRKGEQRCDWEKIKSKL